VLNQLACAAFAAERPNDAIKYFRQIRRIDPTIIDYMDLFGFLLMKEGDDAELNKLANEILAISADRPQGWLVVAQYCEMKGEAEKAIHFIDKVSILF
jgi:predicted Zn-dependent protease